MPDVVWYLLGAAVCFESCRRLLKRRNAPARVSPRWLNEHAYNGYGQAWRKGLK